MALATTAGALLLIMSAMAPAAPLCPTGTAAGQCDRPANIAVDATAERLYVVDASNNRINVFDAKTDAFIKAFGYGVLTGSSTFEVCETSCRRGVANGNAKPGQFENATGIAVDSDPSSPSFHDVYVGELGEGIQHPRVQKLDPLAGVDEKGVDFVWMIGSGVNKTSGTNLCTAASGNVCGAAAKGEAEGEFSTVFGASLLTGVGPGGVVYVVDRLRPGGEGAPTQIRLQRFEESGTQVAPQRILAESSQASAAGLAVVPGADDFWITDVEAATLRKFAITGSQIEAIPTGSGGGGVGAVATGAGGRLFIGKGSGPQARVIEFDDSGGTASPTRVFGYGQLITAFTGLALPPSPSENSIFASESFQVGTGSVSRIPFPGPGPQIFPEECKAPSTGNTRATLRSEINPEGELTHYHYQVVTDKQFKIDEFASALRVPAQSSEDPSVSSQPGQALPLFELEEAKFNATGLAPETKYHCRVVAEHTTGSPALGPSGEFETREAFEVREIWASPVGTDSATLNVEINPLGLPTHGFFEYVSDTAFQTEGGWATAQRAPVGEELNFEAGEEFVTRSVQVAGLTPGTLYHYRPVGTNAFEPAGVTKPIWERTFRTYRIPGPFTLPDSRAWELVSPDQKNSAEVGTPGKAAGLFNGEEFSRIVSASSSGDAMTYTSWTSFGSPQGAPSSSQYLSKRSPAGWITQNISPPGFIKNPLQPPFRGFTPDLNFGGFVVSEPPLAEGAQPGVENIYLRDNETGGLRALTTEAPFFTPSGDLPNFCSAFGGASSDGSRAFFASDGAMAEATIGVGFSLYEHSSSGPLQPVSILPDDSLAKPADQTGFGAGGNFCKMDQAIIANAVSDDGSIAFWTYGGKFQGAEQPLLARVNGLNTVQLDEKVAGGTASGKGEFWGATPDGSKAFFTTPQKLMGSATGGSSSLYRYELAKPKPERLTNLTPGGVPPGVQGVVGISRDGAHVYFVAAGALTGEEENDAGQKAKTGANNLYVYREGEVPAIRFIARLSVLDSGAWSPSPERRNARVAANGDLAFLSIETQALSHYNNVILGGGGCQPNIENSLLGDPHCAEAYLYDSSEDQLTCVSCSPSHARPLGPAELPVWTNPIEGPRFLSDDGSRLFFESRDVLSPDDLDGPRRDVYEFERGGAGTCTAQDPAFDPQSNGCVSLISSGRSQDGSFLLDASANGRDVFFGTREQLVGWDTNPHYDVYDAREGGGFPEPPPSPPICVGEACKPPVSAPPSSSSPATPNFQGPGNQKPKKQKKKQQKKKQQKKGKGHKKGSKQGKKGGKKKRAGNDRRAAR